MQTPFSEKKAENSNTKKWLVAYTRSRCEMEVKRRLQEKGFDVFVPTIQRLKQWSDRKKVVEEPLFKSYVFAQITHKEYTQAIGTQGLVFFLQLGGKLLHITEKEIEIIQKATTTYSEVSIDRSEMIVGDRVIITKGVLQGLTGVLIKEMGKYKVMIDLESLDQSLFITLPKSILKKI